MHTWLRAFVCHLLVHVRIHVCKTCRYPGGPFFDMWRSVFSTGDAGRVLTAWEAKAKFGRRNVCFDKLVVGIVGAFVGGFLFSLAGLDAIGFIGALVSATVGAVVLLWVVGMINRA